MTKKETVRILGMLDCYYRDNRKIDPETMADAWHEIIADYEYDDIRRAVVEFVRTDRREYPTFPVPSQIIGGLETLDERERKWVNRIILGLMYGKDHEGLEDGCKRYLNKRNYERVADTWEYIRMVEHRDELVALLKKLHREELNG